MAAKREKGKIAHTEWPAIVGRHVDGESLASIARSYGCTAPAIRYIVNRKDGGAAGSRNSSTVSVPAKQTTPAGPTVPAAKAPEPESAPPRNSEIVAGSGIDRALRDRVNSDISAFLVAFDAAFVADSPKNLAALRDATDRLLRAGARTRITLEQMAARDEPNFAASRTEPDRDGVLATARSD